MAIISESEALKLAREAGATVFGPDYHESIALSVEQLVKFAELVAATDSFNRLPQHERDAILR